MVGAVRLLGAVGRVGLLRPFGTVRAGRAANCPARWWDRRSIPELSAAAGVGPVAGVGAIGAVGVFG